LGECQPHSRYNVTRGFVVARKLFVDCRRSSWLLWSGVFWYIEW